MRLEKKYKETLVKKLKEELGLSNVMQVPRVEKVVINMGVGEAIQNRAALEKSVEQLTRLAGQKAVITTAKKSISNFKLREGMAIGCRVTLRGPRMYEFLERFINIALPRVRDFRGISPKSFDGRGNYTVGVKDQLIFPEIDFGKVDATRGMNICVVTSAKTDEHGRALLTGLGFPFRKQN
ncbi:MAG: 50S ribosomal protein L5 [Acidobacteria bacterium]|nr:MAG: 50S ribosomal protein L5 [Acidobacteriota bacterium]PIE89992.1 MAG: 50S ribosomal protein L5 [Acidobacteriota bacterium]